MPSWYRRPQCGLISHIITPPAAWAVGTRQERFMNSCCLDHIMTLPSARYSRKTELIRPGNVRFQWACSHHSLSFLFLVRRSGTSNTIFCCCSKWCQKDFDFVADRFYPGGSMQGMECMTSQWAINATVFVRLLDLCIINSPIYSLMFCICWKLTSADS